VSGEAGSILNLTDEGLQAILKRAIRHTLIAGVVVSAALAIGAGWGTGALLFVGSLISAASIYEWQRLVRLINARNNPQGAGQKSGRSAGLAVAFILLRLVLFAAVIYGSLKCFQGSLLALLCGLSLAVATLTWEALRMLRG
jgi:hypothetical protein